MFPRFDLVGDIGIDLGIAQSQEKGQVKGLGSDFVWACFDSEGVGTCY